MLAALINAPKSSSYELNYEVFEEEEPEINSLTSLNRSVPTKTNDLNELMMKKESKPQVERALLNESDKIVNPTLNMKEKETLKKETAIEAEENVIAMEEIQNNAIQAQVLEILEELCLTSIKTIYATLTHDLAMDSLRMVMLLISLEDTFEIELDESDMNPFSLICVQDVINLVMKYVSPAKEEPDNA